MTGRDYQYIDVDQIEEDIANGKAKITEDEPTDVLYGTILDILQLAEAEGMNPDDIDDVMRRIIDFRAEECRKKFRLHPPED